MAHVLPVGLVMLMEVAVKQLIYIVRCLHGHQAVIQVGAMPVQFGVNKPNERDFPQAGERPSGTLGGEALEAWRVGHVKGDRPREKHLRAELPWSCQQRRVVHESLVVEHREHFITSRFLERGPRATDVGARHVGLFRQLRHLRPDLVVPVEFRPVLGHARTIHASAGNLVTPHVHLMHGAVVRARTDGEDRDCDRAFRVRVGYLVREYLDEFLPDLQCEQIYGALLHWWTCQRFV